MRYITEYVHLQEAIQIYTIPLLSGLESGFAIYTKAVGQMFLHLSNPYIKSKKNKKNFYYLKAISKVLILNCFKI